jgi:hypothetical protein
MTTSFPSAPPRSPVEAARAAGIRWQAADQEFVRHQKVCRLYQAGRFCRICERLEIRTNLTSREYARALDDARRTGSR